MSGSTTTTRIPTLQVGSDQTWISDKKFDVPSDATAEFNGRISKFPNSTATTAGGAEIEDGELRVLGVAALTADIQFRSGATVYKWTSDSTEVV